MITDASLTLLALGSTPSGRYHVAIIDGVVGVNRITFYWQPSTSGVFTQHRSFSSGLVFRGPPVAIYTELADSLNADIAVKLEGYFARDT